MDLILNELSLNAELASRHQVRQVIQDFVRCQREFMVKIANDSLITDLDFLCKELYPGYSFQHWRNDPDVDIELRRSFNGLINRSKPYYEDESEFRLNDEIAKGCLIAYNLEGIVISLATLEKWRTPEISGNLLTVDGSGDLKSWDVHVRNIFSNNCVNQLEVCEQNPLLDYTFSKLWEVRGEVFPNLLFCDHVKESFPQHTNCAMLRQVINKLIKFNLYFEDYNGIFNPGFIANITTESQATLQRYAVERTYLCPDGRTRLFYWHGRFTGDYPVELV